MIGRELKPGALAFLLAALLAACGEGTGGPDMRPVGNGLNFIGLSIVLAMLVFVFGGFLGGKK